MGNSMVAADLSLEPIQKHKLNFSLDFWKSFGPCLEYLYFDTSWSLTFFRLHGLRDIHVS